MSTTFPATAPQIGAMKLKCNIASAIETAIEAKFAARLQIASLPNSMSRRNRADMVPENGINAKFSADTAIPALKPSCLKNQTSAHGP